MSLSANVGAFLIMLMIVSGSTLKVAISDNTATDTTLSQPSINSTPALLTYMTSKNVMPNNAIPWNLEVANAYL